MFAFRVNTKQTSKSERKANFGHYYTLTISATPYACIKTYITQRKRLKPTEPHTLSERIQTNERKKKRTTKKIPLSVYWWCVCVCMQQANRSSILHWWRWCMVYEHKLWLMCCADRFEFVCSSSLLLFFFFHFSPILLRFFRFLLFLLRFAFMSWEHTNKQLIACSCTHACIWPISLILRFVAVLHCVRANDDIFMAFRVNSNSHGNRKFTNN